MVFKAKVVLVACPSERAVATLDVQTEPATDPSAHDHDPVDPAALKVMFVGTVVLTTTLVLVTVALVALFSRFTVKTSAEPPRAAVGAAVRAVTAGSTRLGLIVNAVLTVLFVVFTSVQVPSSEMVNVVVTVVVALWVIDVRANVALPVSPSARAVSTEEVHMVPAAEPSAQDHVPLDPAWLKVVFAGMVVLTTTLVLVTLAVAAVLV